MARPASLPWPSSPPTPADLRAFADAEPRPFWTDRLPAREPEPGLRGAVEADLCIIGGGFTGLWAALHAKADDPGRDVVVLEGETIGFGASGRNGGFVVGSLTHGLENGLARFADEMPVLAPYQEPWLAEGRELHARFGYDVEVFGDAAAMQAEIASPTYRGGLWIKDAAGVLDPAKLAVGLLEAAATSGVRVHERTRATDLADVPGGVLLKTERGEARARKVILATGVYQPLVKAVRRYVVPVYDYALMTEPLTAEQRRSLNWDRRQGVGDGGNQFHYYRLTDDDRILWGGFEAVYRYGGPIRPDLDDDHGTFARLVQNFRVTFPQLEDVRFSHRWGGPIDTCSRFSVFFGTALGGKVAYAAGYTGLGVASTRFGARTALDLIDGRETEATRTRYVRSRPVPFPPEPLRTAVVQLTRNRLAAADRREGRRGLWLGALDRLGLGFDS